MRLVGWMSGWFRRHHLPRESLGLGSDPHPKKLTIWLVAVGRAEKFLGDESRRFTFKMFIHEIQHINAVTIPLRASCQ